VKQRTIIIAVLALLFFGCPESNPSSSSTKDDTGSLVTFDIKIGGPYSSGNSRFALTNDGGYIVAGLGLKTPFSIQLIKLNSAGNLLWTKNFDSYRNVSALAVLSDGGFLITSYYFGVTRALIRTNSIGDTLWTVQINDSLLISSNIFVEVADGGIMAVGFAEKNGTPISRIYKISPSGIIEVAGETSLLGLMNGVASPHYFTNQNGELVIVSSHWNSGLTLTVLNDSAKVVSTMSLPLDLRGIYSIKSAFQSNNGNYYIAGECYSPESLHQFFLVNISKSGNLIWVKQYINEATDTLTASVFPEALCELKGGGFAMVGNASKWPNYNSVIHPFLIRYSSTGDTIGISIFLKPDSVNQAVWKDIRPTQDGGMVIFGTYVTKDSLANSLGTLWLRKLKYNGTI